MYHQKTEPNSFDHIQKITQNTLPASHCTPQVLKASYRSSSPNMRNERQFLAVIILCLQCWAGSGRTSDQKSQRAGPVPLLIEKIKSTCCQCGSIHSRLTLRGGDADSSTSNQVIILPTAPPSCIVSISVIHMLVHATSGLGKASRCENSFDVCSDVSQRSNSMKRNDTPFKPGSAFGSPCECAKNAFLHARLLRVIRALMLMLSHTSLPFTGQLYKNYFPRQS